MLKKRILSLCLVLFFFLLHTTAEAALLYYILDGSGSMWGRVNGEMKIVAARKVLTQLISEMPQDMEYGLTVYGHRKKGDCNDISEVIPPGSLERSSAAKAIAAIRPKGKTPIAATVKQVAERLRNRESETTIVLISDGLETCGGDPCEVVRKLKNSGIKFVMHTVGLDVDQDASRQLACMARAGGGRYFSASNASELLESLSMVQKSVVERQPMALPEPPALPEQKISQNVSSSSRSIRIKVNRPGKIIPVPPAWLKKPYCWKLVDPETGAVKGRFKTLETVTVPVGEYQIVWHQYEHYSSEIALGEVVRVKAGETVEVPLTTAVRLNVPSWVRKPYSWGLRDPETGKKIFKSNRLEPFLVPAGVFDVLWHQSEHRAWELVVGHVMLEPDKLNEVTVATAFNPVPADWMQKKIYWWGLVNRSGRGSGGKWIARFKDNFGPQLVPPGKYSLVYRLSEHGTTDSFLGHVEIKPDSMNEFRINTGISFILPPGASPPYLIEIIALDKNGKPLRKIKINGRYIKKKFGNIALAPGFYRIRYRQKEYGSTTITLVDSFELPSGVLAEIEL
jgi:Ca-activated chloride channel family protein